MKLTLNEQFNINSVVEQHKILVQATMLLQGREGVLETEKELYLILALVNAMVNEDLVELCNDDNRDLITIMEEDVEPFFLEHLGTTIPRELYMDLRFMLLNRCREIWENQHSVMGLIDTLLLAIGSLSEEDKKEALVQTAHIAEKVYENRTEKLEKQGEEMNAKMAELINKYQVQKDNAE